MEPRDPAICDVSNNKEGKDEMIKASINLQDLRRRLYVKAKAEPSWRFWGLYVHVCKMETLREAYEMAKQNDGAPGIDGVTFETIEAQGGQFFVGVFFSSVFMTFAYVVEHSRHATRKGIPLRGGLFGKVCRRKLRQRAQHQCDRFERRLAACPL